MLARRVTSEDISRQGLSGILTNVRASSMNASRAFKNIFHKVKPRNGSSGMLAGCRGRQPLHFRISSIKASE